MPSKITLALVAVAAYGTAQVVAAPFQQPYDLVERDYAETLDARMFDDEFNGFYARQTGGAEPSPVFARGWLSSMTGKFGGPKPPPAHPFGAPHPPHPYPHDLTHPQHHAGGGFQGGHQLGYSHPNQQHHNPYAQQHHVPSTHHHQAPYGHPHQGSAYRRELAAAAKPVTDASSASGAVVDEPKSGAHAATSHRKHHIHRLTQEDIAKLSPEERHAYKMRARKAAAQRKKGPRRKQMNAAEPTAPKDATAALSRRSRANY